MNLDIQTFEPLWGQWRVDSLIGEGSFGRVYKVFREDFGSTYYSAVKHISIPQNQSQADMAFEEGYGTDQDTLKEYFRDIVQGIVSEIEIMNKLQGDSHIVSYADHLIAEKNGAVGWDIFIRMELLTPISKYYSKKPYTVQDIVKLGIDICLGLERCQKINLIHRDIKPSNIFVSDIGDFKLGDFGISRQIEKTTVGLSRKGTPLYMAPEVYLGSAYNASVDTYSLALVLYRYLNNNRLPFLPTTGRFKQDDNDKALDRRISGDAIPAPVFADSKLSGIICKACSYSPKDRYESAKEFRAELESEYALIFSSTPAVIGNVDCDSAGSDSASCIGLSQGAEFTAAKIETEPKREGTVHLFAADVSAKKQITSLAENESDNKADESSVPEPVIPDTDAEIPVRESPLKHILSSIKNTKRKTLLIFIPLLVVLVVGLSIFGASLLNNPEKTVSMTATISELTVGETFQLKAGDTDNQELNWESSDPAIATVDANGNVLAITPGNVIITVSVVGSGSGTTAAITILPALKNIILNKETTTILIGGQEQLKVMSDPIGLKIPELIWESNNPAVASVDSSGLVTAVSEGIAEINVIAKSGVFKAECSVSVQATAIPITGIQIDPNTISGMVGNQMNLTCQITPSNATNQNIVWSSSASAIASIDSVGVVTAVAPGDAVITVQTADGNMKSTCLVHIDPMAVTSVPTAIPVAQAASWSGWTASLPAGVTDSKYAIETKTQYRSRQQIAATSDWSAWQSNDPSGTNRSVEKQYQVRTKAYTTSTAGSMDGWTQYGTPAVTYGEWSGWSTTAATSSATLGVESKDVSVTNYKTVYNYNSYKYWNPNYSAYYYSFAYSGYDGQWLYKTSDSRLAVYKYVTDESGGSHAAYYADGILWYNETSSQVENGSTTHKEYRTRSITTTYNYWQWSAWSGWTSGDYTGTAADTEVNYQYRYKETTTSWGNWSSWSDAAVAASDTVDVQTQTLYRYKAK